MITCDYAGLEPLKEAAVKHKIWIPLLTAEFGFDLGRAGMSCGQSPIGT